MDEKFVEIATADGRMECFVTHPEEGGPFPAVFILTDIYGMREEMYDVARRFGTCGYYAIVPDLHHRQGKVRVQVPEAQRRWSSEHITDAEERQVRAAGQAMDDGKAMADIGAALEFLKREPVKPGAKGAVGFCMGGRLVLVAAAHFPDDFRATAGLHPSRIVHDGPLSPHRFGDKFRGEIYCGFPEDDPLAPTATIEAFAAAVKGQPVTYRWDRHAGAVHGYAPPYRAVHHRVAANKDFERIMAMFRRQIPVTG
jgi:carboxymethylenebutenolidase